MEKDEKNWYNSANVITNLIIITILFIMISSQSFAANGDNSFKLITSMINHNITYVLILIYFVLLKFKIGKKYFNYLNLFLLVLYLISTITSLLTLFQSFGLNTVFDFIINFVFLVYFSHTMFRDTSYWKEYRLGDSPFNEFDNDWYFYVVVILGVLSLCINLISVVEIKGVILAILDCIYVVLFGRYVYLYRDYLDSHKISINNSGNFDEIKDNIKESINKVNDIIVDTTDKLVDDTKEISKKLNDNNEKDKKDSKNNKKKGDNK